ncbi:hypothetical protein [Paenibacillus sp. H1-7]|uniref:hypothetical protein n=1 Tax=Paenibacillus sp. H1-7 TaxID=2282849 RepID=UPI001EF95BEF|nr:hypothetical protein [Paenibacillus sp. H1-7]
MMDRAGRAEESRRGDKRWIVPEGWKSRGELASDGSCRKAGETCELLCDGTYRKGGRVEAWYQAMDRVEVWKRRGARPGGNGSCRK